MFRVVVNGIGIFVEVEACKTLRTLTPPVPIRMCQTQVEKEDVTFRLVHLVLLNTILLVDRAEARQLLGNRLPLAVCQREQMVATAHQINKGPIKERFVIVVGTAATPFVVPDELAIVPCKVIEKRLDRPVHRVEQSPFPDRPRGQPRNRHTSRYIDHQKSVLLVFYQPI